MPVVHLIAASLRSDVHRDLVDAASCAAAELDTAPGVRAARVGRSPTHLVAAVWLAEPADLEPFAASPPHMNFVMRGLAPAIQGMWSASVAVDREPPPADVGSLAHAALWVCAVPEADGIFEWQIRRQLDLIDGLAGNAWLGPTIEERERYRAGGVVLLAAEEIEPFEAALAAADGDSLLLETALAPFAAERAPS
jgi:hypothetical protein